MLLQFLLSVASWQYNIALEFAIAKCQRYVNGYHARRECSPVQQHEVCGFLNTKTRVTLGLVFGRIFWNWFIQNNIAWSDWSNFGVLPLPSSLFTASTFWRSNAFNLRWQVRLDDGAGHSLRAINLEVLSDSVSSSSRVRVKGGVWRAHLWICQGWCGERGKSFDENFESIQTVFIDWPICTWLYLYHMSYEIVHMLIFSWIHLPKQMVPWKRCFPKLFMKLLVALVFPYFVKIIAEGSHANETSPKKTLT